MADSYYHRNPLSLFSSKDRGDNVRTSEGEQVFILIWVGKSPRLFSVEVACEAWQVICLDSKLIQSISRCAYVERTNYDWYYSYVPRLLMGKVQLWCEI